MTMNELAKRFSESFGRFTGILSVSIKQRTNYRFNFYMAIIGSFLTTTLLYYLWTAIYHNSASFSMSYQTLITYICLGQAFSFSRPSQRGVFYWIGNNISSGNIILDLVRPADFQLMSFYNILGSYIMDALMVSLPSYLIAVIVFHINFPASFEALFGFIISMSGSFFLVFSLDFFIGLMAFWIISVWGLGYAKMAVIDILAGTIIPINLFPDWLKRIAILLPFKDFAYTPLAIYIGQIKGIDIWYSILIQYAWGFALFFLTRLLWLKAKKRLEIQGG